MVTVGSVIGGRFRIEQILGAGGMGIVVAATHLELGNRVAIKFLRDEMAQNPTVVERFLREARSVVSLRTEHVCRVSDVGRLDSGAPYIVMEMLDGVDLQRAVAKSPLPMTTAVEYVMQACLALAEAHHHGIIHRDLKPANLFVTRRPDGGPLVKVLDFGIAKALADTSAHLTLQSAMGSPGYMSPEQLQSARDVDVTTDIWSLGVTLYQLLSARLPFPAATPTEIAIRVAADPPAPLDVDANLRAVIWRCLEKDRGQRYPSVAALVAELAPFGGPAGRRIAAAVGQIGQTRQTGLHALRAPSEPPHVAVNAPTAASIVPARAASVAPVSAPARRAVTGDDSRPRRAVTGDESRPRRAVTGDEVSPARPRRWPLVVLPLIALAAGGGAVALYMQSQSAQPQTPATRDAAIVVASPDARERVVVVTTVADASDPWKAVDSGPEVEAPPIDAATIDADEPDPPFVATDIFPNMFGPMGKGCFEMMKVKGGLDSISPMQLAMCWCAAKNGAKAKAAIDRLTDPTMAKQMRDFCKQAGTKLP